MTVKRNIRISLILILISIPISSFTQVVEPPTSTDDFSWMRWVIIVLVGALATAFGIIKKVYDDRIKDKNDQIKTLTEQIKTLTDEKDQLNKDIIDKVIPSLVSATDVIKTFLFKNE